MSSADRRLAKALAFHQEGRFLAAANLLLEGFREDPNDPVIAHQLGVVLHAAGDLEGAVGFLLRSHHARPEDPEITAHLIVVLHELGREEEATERLLAGLEAGAEPVLIAGAVMRDGSQSAA